MYPDCETTLNQNRFFNKKELYCHVHFRISSVSYPYVIRISTLYFPIEIFNGYGWNTAEEI